MSFLSDTFTDTDGTSITSHTGETGATWTHETGDGLGGVGTIASGRVRGGATDGGFFYSSGTPTDADYDVEAVIRKLSSYSGVCQVAGRMATGANTCYLWGPNDFASNWQIRKMVSATETVLATFSHTDTLNTDFTAKLQMRGTAIKGFVDGTQQASVTDSSITSAGQAGLEIYGANTASDGWQIDSITGTDAPALPSIRAKGTYGSGTTSFTAAVPSGFQTGDVLIIVMESSDSTTAAGTPDTPTGWTKLYEETTGDGGSGVTTTTIFGKIAGGSETDLTVTGVGNHCSGSMFAIKNHGCSVIGDVQVGTGNSGNNATPTALGITTAADNTLVMMAVGMSSDANSTAAFSAWTNSNLTDFIESEDHTVATGAGGGIGVAAGLMATAGATGNSTATMTSTRWRAVHLGFPPVATATEVLAATPAGVATVTADLTERVSLAAAPAGVASVSADLTERVALASSTLGVAVVTADLTIPGLTEVLAATPAGVAAVSADLDIFDQLAATVAGVATIAGDLKIIAQLAASPAGVATVSAQLAERVALGASVLGQGSVAGDISGTGGGVVSTQDDHAFWMYHYY